MNWFKKSKVDVSEQIRLTSKHLHDALAELDHIKDLDIPMKTEIKDLYEDVYTANEEALEIRKFLSKIAGFTTVNISKSEALQLLATMEITAWSTGIDTTNDKWQDDIEEVEKVEGKNRIIFRLTNNRFVDAEK